MPAAVAAPLPPAALHASALVVDAHCDVAQVMLDERRDIGRRLRSTHFDLPRAAQGGLAAQFFALWVEPDAYHGEGAWARTLALLGAVERAAAAHPGRLAPATSAAEVRAHHAAGRVAAILALEGAHGLGTDDPALVLRRVGELAARGLRCFGLTWNNSNALAGAATAADGVGLTALGRRVVRDLERRGILVDVSHASDAAVRDLLAVARRPILASHSNARALCGVSRNLPDDLIRAIAAGGGVVCANYFPGFLDAPTFERLNRLKAAAAADPAPRAAGPRGHAAARRRACAATRALPEVPLARLVQHLRHLAAVAGPAHVGLGSDFDGMWMTPAGLPDVAALPRLTAALRPHFSDDEVRGILGGNLLRLLAIPRG
ncbi:MAG TPA: membrane dipeptidase [Polyangia bacterium]